MPHPEDFLQPERGPEQAMTTFIHDLVGNAFDTPELINRAAELKADLSRANLPDTTQQEYGLSTALDRCEIPLEATKISRIEAEVAHALFRARVWLEAGYATKAKDILLGPVETLDDVVYYDQDPELDKDRLKQLIQRLEDIRLSL